MIIRQTCTYSQENNQKTDTFMVHHICISFLHEKMGPKLVPFLNINLPINERKNYLRFLIET